MWNNNKKLHHDNNINVTSIYLVLPREVFKKSFKAGLPKLESPMHDERRKQYKNN